MRGLPLWQPWASLIAVGAKRVETRSYAPDRVGIRVGQRLGIHATKTRDHLPIRERYPFNGYLAEQGILPLGAIVATATLARAAEMTAASIETLRRDHPHEHAFGHYEPGRWAWVLADVERLEMPLAWAGSQTAFYVPDDLLDGGVPQGRLL